MYDYIIAGYSLGNFGSGYNGYGGYGGYRPFGAFGFNQDREQNPLIRQAEVTKYYVNFVLYTPTC